MTLSATWHFGPEFGREHPLRLSVCGITRAEERYKLLGSVALIHVEGEQTAVHAEDVTSQALQLSFLIVPCRAVTFYEGQDIGHELYDAIRINGEGIRKFGAEVYG